MQVERTLEIGGLRLRVSAPAVAGRALDDKFAAFIVASEGPEGAIDATLEFESVASAFSNDFHLQEEETMPLAANADGSRVTLGPAGDFCAELELDDSGGYARARFARHLGDVDAVVRMAISTLLPSRGALLFHAAAVVARPEAGGVTVLAGASGAGKTTAARAFSPALCDELVIVHVGEDDRSDAVSGTPYWRGRSARSPLDHLVLLERGVGTREKLRGARALAVMTPHLARYIALPAVDAQIFALLGRLVARRGTLRLACPEGDAYVPYLRHALVSEALPC